jgi:hypothetical protein
MQSGHLFGLSVGLFSEMNKSFLLGPRKNTPRNIALVIAAVTYKETQLKSLRVEDLSLKAGK